MQKAKNNKTPTGIKETLTINDVITFLILFASFWIQDGLVWKSAKALFAVLYLKLANRISGPGEVYLSMRPVPEPALAPPFWKASYTRSIFQDMEKFPFPPFLQQVVADMVKDANDLITTYIMVERRTDVA